MHRDQPLAIGAGGHSFWRCFESSLIPQYVYWMCHAMLWCKE